MRRVLGVLWPVESVMEQDDHGGLIYLDAVHRVPPASFASSVAAVLFVIADDVDPCHLQSRCASRRHSVDTVFDRDSKLD